jgi:ribosomal protein S27E
MTLLVLCPNCNNNQQTNPKVLVGAKKKCVYCGKTFTIYSEKGINRILKRL